MAVEVPLGMLVTAQIVNEDIGQKYVQQTLTMI
jgi:hypothetical protein